MRFSSSGSWRQADDVLALNGGNASGVGFPFRIAAGTCPVFGQPQGRELVYTMYDSNHRIIWLGRIVSTSQQWLPGMQGTYSPLFDLSKLLAGTSNTSRQDTLQELRILTRSFRDDARSPP